MPEDINEFDKLDAEESVPTKDFSNVPQGQDDLISSGAAGTAYDWSKAPEMAKAPPRIDLDGKIVTIKKADIILPPESSTWYPTKSGDKEFKPCNLVLYYDADGQQEKVSGIKVFKRVEDGKDKYSHPTIYKEGNNQASTLLKIYAEFKDKNIQECSLREFMGFLNSQPKAKIKVEEVENPQTHEKIQKNLVGEFVK